MVISRFMLKLFQLQLLISVMAIYLIQSERLIMPADEYEAKDLVYKWETEGTPEKWRNHMRRSVQIYSGKYKGDEKRECQGVLR